MNLQGRRSRVGRGELGSRRALRPPAGLLPLSLALRQVCGTGVASPLSAGGQGLPYPVDAEHWDIYSLFLHCSNGIPLPLGVCQAPQGTLMLGP